MRASLPTKSFLPPSGSVAPRKIGSRRAPETGTLDGMGIAVTPIDPADTAAAEQAYEISRTAEAADLPDFPVADRRNFLAGFSHPWPGKRFERALARLDGQPAGYLSLELPQDDNTDNASVDLTVAPAFRRRGVGRALHDYAVDLTRREGRKRLVGSTVEELPGGPAHDGAGAAFAATTGAKAALAEVRRRLDVTALDEAALDRMLVEGWAHAAGYTLVQWRGSVPDEYVDDVAYLDGRLIEDAPMGELEWEPEKSDADKLRAIEAAQDARGMRNYHTGVRHDASGRLVAWTLINFAATEPWHAWQQITIVEPRHRGHRLGAIVKVENLRHVLAHEPALTAVDTWNAAVNDHMIAINDAMGFRPVDTWTNWQLTL